MVAIFWASRKWQRSAVWRTWTIALKAAFGLPLTEQERAIFCAICRRPRPTQNKQRVREFRCGLKVAVIAIAASLKTQ